MPLTWAALYERGADLVSSMTFLYVVKFGCFFLILEGGIDTPLSTWSFYLPLFRDFLFKLPPLNAPTFFKHNLIYSMRPFRC